MPTRYKAMAMVRSSKGFRPGARHARPGSVYRLSFHDTSVRLRSKTARLEVRSAIGLRALRD